MPATVVPTAQKRINRNIFSELITCKMARMLYQQEIGFAIVGCGLIGSRRAAVLPPGSLKYVFDIQENRASELARSHPGCIPTDTLEKLFRSETVQAVIVATANNALAPVSLAAVQAGKHVLVEKPGAIFSEQLAEIESVAAATGSLVRIGYNHRFHPAFLKIQELTRTEAPGNILFLRGRYGHGGRVGYEREWRADPKLSGGGELIDQGVHLIDLASMFLGKFTQIDGHAVTAFWDMPVDDNAFLSLRTPDGKTAWLHVSCTEWKNLFSLEIYFQHAKLQVDGLGGSYGVERLTYYKMLPEMGPPETTIYEFPRGDSSWAVETNEFIEDIRTGRTPSPGLAEGRRVLEIVETIYRKSGYR
jgi:predicted dehydrogenase